jgi:Nucleotidyltransferase domain
VGLLQIKFANILFFDFFGGLDNFKFSNTPYLGLITQYLSEATRFDGLECLTLFRSVARGQALKTSDVDLLAVFKSKRQVDEALKRIAHMQLHGDPFEEIGFLKNFGIETNISLLPMTEGQFLNHPIVLLDFFQMQSFYSITGFSKANLGKSRSDYERLVQKRGFNYRAMNGTGISTPLSMKLRILLFENQ